MKKKAKRKYKKKTEYEKKLIRHQKIINEYDEIIKNRESNEDKYTQLFTKILTYPEIMVSKYP